MIDSIWISVRAYVVVVVATWMGGRRIEPPAIEFAVPLRPATEPTVWDRLGLWTAVAVVLIPIAYAYPLMQLISHPRYGSPGYQPF